MTQTQAMAGLAHAIDGDAASEQSLCAQCAYRVYNTFIHIDAPRIGTRRVKSAPGHLLLRGRAENAVACTPTHEAEVWDMHSWLVLRQVAYEFQGSDMPPLETSSFNTAAHEAEDLDDMPPRADAHAQHQQAQTKSTHNFRKRQSKRQAKFRQIEEDAAKAADEIAAIAKTCVAVWIHRAIIWIHSGNLDAKCNTEPPLPPPLAPPSDFRKHDG